jgi:hypothetical protein
MKTPEQKVAEQLVNLTEDHWFNAASLARYITDQPYYTTDRIMELVAQIIKWGGRRHEDELTPSGIYNSNTSSEGLFLANELSKTLDKLNKTYGKTSSFLNNISERTDCIRSKYYSDMANIYLVG